MSLSQSRAADRKKMADEVWALAKEHGYAVTHGLFAGPREVQLDIEMPRGLQLRVEFDGQNANGPNCWVLPWHIGFGSDAKLAQGVLGDVNPYHFAKCTHVIHGYSNLLEYLRESFVHIDNGTAFQ